MTDSTPATVAADYFDALSRGDVPAAMGLLSLDPPMGPWWVVSA